MASQSVPSRHDSNSSHDERFLNLANQLCQHLSSEGIPCRAALPGLPYFSKLRADQKKEINSHLEFYLELCVQQIAEGYQIKDSLSFTWRALKKLGLVPPSDMFSFITDQDIVEIYDNEGRQLYRNFRFFDFCSYSLEELYSVEWWNLFERDHKNTQDLFRVVDKIFSGEISEIVDAKCEPHPVTERISEQKFTIFYERAFAGPLCREHRVDAVVAIVRGSLITKTA